MDICKKRLSSQKVNDHVLLVIAANVEKILFFAAEDFFLIAVGIYQLIQHKATPPALAIGPAREYTLRVFLFFWHII